MIKPAILESNAPTGRGRAAGVTCGTALCAAASGDAPALTRLLERDANLARAEYWYTQPIHFAVREGHGEAVARLLDAAPTVLVGMSGEDLITLVRDRGHEAVAACSTTRSPSAAGSRQPTARPITRFMTRPRQGIGPASVRSSTTTRSLRIASTAPAARRCIERLLPRHPRWLGSCWIGEPTSMPFTCRPRLEQRLRRRVLPAHRSGPLGQSVLEPAR